MRNKHRRILAVFMALTVLTGTAAYAEYAAPVAENLELTTYRNTSVGGKMAAIAAKDSHLEYIITTEPVKGTLDVSQDGHFIYTPNESKRGRDYFGYKAVDENGTESQEATVIIHIQHKKPTIQYTDTKGLSCDYAASALAELELFTGLQVGGNFYFRPDDVMDRNEFTEMCKALMGNTAAEEAVSTLDRDPLDYGEAAVIMNELLGISSVGCLNIETVAGQDETCLQAVSNLHGCGILTESAIPLSNSLTRGEAASMLLRAVAVLDAR